MAGTTRLELATSAVTGQRSNQLNYVPNLVGIRTEKDGILCYFISVTEGRLEVTACSNTTAAADLPRCHFVFSIPALFPVTCPLFPLSVYNFSNVYRCKGLLYSKRKRAARKN